MVDSSNVRGSRRIGEVIETSTVRVWAECDHLNELPRLGSVVEVSTTNGDLILGIVSYCETSGIDSTRRAVRRGSDELRDEEIYRRHPELTRVLRSTFEAVPVAVMHGERVRCVVPPVPPPLHYSVETATGVTLRRLTDRFDYFPMLSRHTGEVAAEQVMVAHVRETYEQRGHDDAWLERAASEIGRIYAQQYDLLLPVLQAIDPSRDADTIDRLLR